MIVKRIRDICATLLSMIARIMFAVQRCAPTNNVNLVIGIISFIVLTIGGGISLVVGLVEYFRGNSSVLIYATSIICVAFMIISPFLLSGGYICKKITSQKIVNEDDLTGMPAGVRSITLNELKYGLHNLHDYSVSRDALDSVNTFHSKSSVTSESDVIYLVTMFGTTVIYVNTGFMSIAKLDEAIVSVIKLKIKDVIKKYNDTYAHNGNDCVSTWMKQ